MVSEMVGAKERNEASPLRLIFGNPDRHKTTPTAVPQSGISSDSRNCETLAGVPQSGINSDSRSCETLAGSKPSCFVVSHDLQR